MAALCMLFESVGQSGLTKGGTEVAFRCSLLAMLSAIDNQEPGDDGVDVPDKSALINPFLLSNLLRIALTDFETAFDSLLQVRVGEAVTKIGELKPLARSTVMCYTENSLSVFVQDGDLAYALPSESGVNQGCPAAQIPFGGSIVPLCRILQQALIGTSASTRWIWDDCTISGGANDVVCTGFRTLHSHSKHFGLTLHTHNDKLAIYLPQVDEALYNSLVEGSANNHAVDIAGSDLVGDLVRFGFRVRFDGVERVLGDPY